MVHHGVFRALGEARDVPSFESSMRLIADATEFAHFSCMFIQEHAHKRATIFNIYDTPEAYESIYLDPALGERDPVITILKTTSAPFVWNQQTYADAHSVDIWDQQAAFGYHCGIAIALHLPNQQHFTMGFDRRERMPQLDDRRATDILAALTLAATFAICSVQSLATKQLPKPRVSLSKRELEALAWTLDGKTAWEIGQILSISERTAVKYLHSAARKLGATNKVHAAYTAVRLGLIG